MNSQQWLSHTSLAERGRVADTITNLGEVEILDLVMHIEVTENGNWPSITAYYTPDQHPPN